MLYDYRMITDRLSDDKRHVSVELYMAQWQAKGTLCLPPRCPLVFPVSCLTAPYGCAAATKSIMFQSLAQCTHCLLRLDNILRR